MQSKIYPKLCFEKNSINGGLFKRVLPFLFQPNEKKALSTLQHLAYVFPIHMHRHQLNLPNFTLTQTCGIFRIRPIL